jgi:hypothetical protein
LVGQEGLCLCSSSISGGVSRKVMSPAIILSRSTLESLIEAD